MILENKILFALLSAIFAFAVTYMAIPSIIRVAHLKHLIDDPEDDRRVHTEKTPNLGGLAIFAGISLATLFFVDVKIMPELPFVIGSMLILFFIGIKDDILMIAPLTKLVGQIVAGGIVVVFGGVQLTDLHGFFGINHIHPGFGIPLTIFTIITITNALNFIDGIDGLASSISIIISLSFGVWFFLVGDFQYGLFSVIIIGALLAFTRFNVFSKTQKIFMGDTGSLILGFVLAVLVVHFNEKNLELQGHDYFVLPSPSVSFGVMIIPLFDMLRVMFIRVLRRRPVMYPDKNHIHHICLRLGLSHRQAVVAISLVNIFFVIFSFWAADFLTIRRLLLIQLIIAAVSSYITSVLLERKERRNNKS